MSGNRREFLRRMIAFSALAVTGFLGLFELLENQPSIQPQQQTRDTTQQSSTTTEQSKTGSQTSRSTTQSSQSAQSTLTSTPPGTTTQTSHSSSATVPSGYIFVTAISALAGQSSAYFNHPNFGTSLLLNFNGAWKAFNAACTHAGCTVQYTSSSIYCPCHAGYFSPSDGTVQGGPPRTPLPEYGVLVQDNDLYVTSTVIN